MKQKILAATISTFLATSAYSGTLTTDGEDLILSTKGGIKIHNEDGSKSFQLGGRLQWDYTDDEYDMANGTTGEKTDFDVRRARLYVKGNVGDWAYKAQFNVAEGDGSKGGNAEDLYIRYTGFGKKANITVGKQKEPFGLEELTSSKDITSLERSAMTELYAPGRSGGVQVHGKGSNWTYGIGIFEADGDSSNDFDDTALTARATFTPLKTDDSIVHIGVGYTDRDGATRADESDAYNLELAGVMGPFHAQAEYFDGESGGVDADGYYLQFGWVITGEMRPYKEGKFKKVKPANKSGAWEVVLRIEEGDGKYSDVGLATTDGEQTTLGVNYYVNSNVRLGLSYMDGEEDTSGLEGEEVRLRTQFTF